MRGLLGIASLALFGGVGALAGEQPVQLAGRYLYRVPAGDSPEVALRRLASAMWNTQDTLPTVLADNGISDTRTVAAGRMLRVPSPRESSEQQTAFVPGLRLDVTPRGGGPLRVDCDPCGPPRNAMLGAGRGLNLRVADADDVVRVPLVAGVERYDGSLQDLRAWELPDGDVLLAVKMHSESAPGRLALLRLAPGPEVKLLRAIDLESGASDAVVLRAVIERGRFVLTATRTGQGESPQRFVYDVRTRALTGDREGGAR